MSSDEEPSMNEPLECSKCKGDIPVSRVDQTASDDRSRHTFLTRCGHIICARCYDNVRISSRPCGVCEEVIQHAELQRIFFEQVCGPVPEEVQELQGRADEMKKENKTLRETEVKLKERLAELSRMVDEEADKLEEAIEETLALLRQA